MKRFILAVIFTLWLIGTCFAANKTTVVSSDNVYRNTRIIKIVATADDGDATFATLTLNGSTTGISKGDTEGWSLFLLYIDGNHAGTEILEDCDITILLSIGTLSVDTLGGNGANILDNTADRVAYFESDSMPVTTPITGDLIVTPDSAAENNVNSAVVNIYIVMEKY
jgi:hypothetical protein